MAEFNAPSPEPLRLEAGEYWVELSFADGFTSSRSVRIETEKMTKLVVRKANLRASR